MTTFRLLVRLTRPHFLLGAALLYALGVGIAHYLGHPINSGLYFFGQAWVTLLQLAAHLLNEYFDSPTDADNPHRTFFTGGSDALGPGKLPRPVALWLAMACLAAVASFTIPLLQSIINTPALAAVLLMAFLAAFYYSVPPIRLASSGYGELTTSVLVASLTPAFAFLLQTGELHRLLAMTTFPLVLIHLSMMLAFELPDYASDLKHNKRTLMIRIGWERGMLLHNILLMTAFVIFGLAVIFGLPIPIAGPVFLALPLAVFQIWQMNRIAAGSKPNWLGLTLTAVATFGVAAYLLTFEFWTR